MSKLIRTRQPRRSKRACITRVLPPADIYCGYSSDTFPDAGCAKQFTKVCLLHNLIHTNFKDHNNWRYRMALGVAQVDGGFD